MVHPIQTRDTIDGCGYPLCFQTLRGGARPGVLGLTDSEDIFTTEARALGGHQKEAVVTEGLGGSAWRMVSDEGPALGGTDLAPFPLGYMSAGLLGELLQRIAQTSIIQGINLNSLTGDLFNDYVFKGSFFKGTGHGTAHRPRFSLQARSTAPARQVLDLVSMAVTASPLIAAWSTPLRNTFALYVNGRRVALRDLEPSAASANDPFATWSQAPAPLSLDDATQDIVSKSNPVEVKNPTQPSGWESGQVDIPIHGHCESALGLNRSVTWANRLGGSAFAICSDDRSSGNLAPSALAHAFAGIAFCFMTQLLRYVEHHHLRVRALRLVQVSPCRTASGSAYALPLDTHVFVHTDESVEVMENLMHMSARTCYLHAALGATLPPEVEVILNGQTVSG